MRRLNVRAAQLDSCIKNRRFALATQPQRPKLFPGEILLLDLVLEDALTLGKKDSRIEWVLLFNNYQRDSDGSKSKLYWPHEGRIWSWILVCSEARRVERPFSLENLGLSQDYWGQDNGRLISSADEKIIMLYISGSKI
ncbi:MAG: hypothetical protein NPIRA03_09700 [Nitrospirales bacterium]|nr:MAG: hypothetical protein NPIRA03_09700 [Nitrospirales bacterium]